jgi:hypothetical protein
MSILSAVACGGVGPEGALDEGAVADTTEALRIGDDAILRTKGPYMPPTAANLKVWGYRVNDANGTLKMCPWDYTTCQSWGSPSVGSKSGPSIWYPPPFYSHAADAIAVLGKDNKIWQTQAGAAGWSPNYWYNPGTTSYGFTPASAPSIATSVAKDHIVMAILDGNGQAWFRRKMQGLDAPWTQAAAKRLKAAPNVFFDMNGDVRIIGVDAVNHKAYMSRCGYPTCFTSWTELPGGGTWSSGVSCSARYAPSTPRGTVEIWQCSGVRRSTNVNIDTQIGRLVLYALDTAVLYNDSFPSSEKSDSTPTVGAQVDTYGSVVDNLIIVEGTDGRYYDRTISSLGTFNWAGQ